MLFVTKNEETYFSCYFIIIFLQFCGHTIGDGSIFIGQLPT